MEMYHNHDCHLSPEDSCETCELYWALPKKSYSVVQGGEIFVIALALIAMWVHASVWVFLPLSGILFFEIGRLLVIK